jgi:hypothetical protein
MSGRLSGRSMEERRDTAAKEERERKRERRKRNKEKERKRGMKKKHNL